MDPLALTTGINTLAVAVACRLGDEELGLLALVLTQLGDTLGTIAAQRVLCESCRKKTDDRGDAAGAGEARVKAGGAPA